MPCKEPLVAYQCANGEVVFDERKKYDTVRQLLLPCRQCQWCRLERSRAWAIRILHEAALYENNVFLSLTYDDQHLPPNGNLVYRDYQLFMKRLRQAVVRETTALGKGGDNSTTAPNFITTLRADMGARPHAPLRFYMAGEYGDQLGRPHFHACIFNLGFLDQEPLRKTKTGHQLYRSATLEKIWTEGFSSIGAVTFESAAYVARYVMKKVTGNQAKKHYEQTNLETGEITNKKAEFNNMSRRPGIGKAWLEKYASDVYPEGKLTTGGHLQKPPRYYDEQFKKADPIAYEQMQYLRDCEARAHASDNTPERRLVKDQVLRAKTSALKRTLN